VSARGATVTPVGPQGSHLIGSLAYANSLIVVPEETTSLAANETVNAMVLDRTF
jgi:molybdopterin molybdotransferase